MRNLDNHNVDAPTPQNPFGVFKDDVVPKDGTGTEIYARIYGDIYYALAAILDDGGLTPDNSSEGIVNSQVLTAMKSVIDQRINAYHDGLTPDKSKNWIINSANDYFLEGDVSSVTAGPVYLGTLMYWTGAGSYVVNGVQETSDLPPDNLLDEFGGIRVNNVLKIEVVTGSAMGASDFVLLSHLIEGLNLSEMWGNALSFRFLIKTPEAGDYTLALHDDKQSGATVYHLTKFTVSAADVWELIEIPNFALPSSTSGTWNFDDNVGLSISICLAAGTNNHGVEGAWTSGTKTAVTTQVNALATSATNILVGPMMLNTGTKCAPYSRHGGDVEGEISKINRYALDMSYRDQSAFSNNGYRYNNIGLPSRMRAGSFYFWKTSRYDNQTEMIGGAGTVTATNNISASFENDNTHIRLFQQGDNPNVSRSGFQGKLFIDSRF